MIYNNCRTNCMMTLTLNKNYLLSLVIRWTVELLPLWFSVSMAHSKRSSLEQITRGLIHSNISFVSGWKFDMSESSRSSSIISSQSYSVNLSKLHKVVFKLPVLNSEVQVTHIYGSGISASCLSSFVCPFLGLFLGNRQLNVARLVTGLERISIVSELFHSLFGFFGWFEGDPTFSRWCVLWR